jgi:hypothetical protein
MAIVGMVLPRLLILYGWVTDPAGWSSLFGSQVWLVLGFVFMPWTTFFLVIFNAAEVGFDVFRIIVLAVAVMGDLATWGIGGLATRRRASSYRS